MTCEEQLRWKNQIHQGGPRPGGRPDACRRPWAACVGHKTNLGHPEISLHTQSAHDVRSVAKHPRVKSSSKTHGRPGGAKSRHTTPSLGRNAELDPRPSPARWAGPSPRWGHTWRVIHPFRFARKCSIPRSCKSASPRPRNVEPRAGCGPSGERDPGEAWERGEGQTQRFFRLGGF